MLLVEGGGGRREEVAAGFADVLDDGCVGGSHFGPEGFVAEALGDADCATGLEDGTKAWRLGC